MANTKNEKFLGLRLSKNGVYRRFLVTLPWVLCDWLLLEHMESFSRMTGRPRGDDPIGLLLFPSLAATFLSWLIFVVKQRTGTALIGPNGTVVLDPKCDAYLWRFGRLRRNNQPINYGQSRKLEVSIEAAFTLPPNSVIVLTFVAKGEIFGDLQSFLRFREFTHYRGNNDQYDIRGEDEKERGTAISRVSGQLQPALRGAITAHHDDLVRLFGSPEGIRPEDGEQQKTIADWLAPFLKPNADKAGARIACVSFSFR